MPIYLKRTENMPVVIATYKGYINNEDVEKMYEETASLLDDLNGRYYRINDVRRSKTDFPGFIQITAAMQQDGKYRTNNPNLCAIFVGTNIWITNFRNLARKQKGLDFPTFHDLEEAFGFIERDMTRE